jgi:hypothetical protein
MKKIVNFVKVKPQPKRRPTSYIFNINLNIFKWWSTVNPEEQDDNTEDVEDQDTIETENDNEINVNLDIVWDDVLPYLD